MFVDEARILVKSGDGGNGCVGFRREKFVPKGGPDGGDGGRGGHVVIQVDPQLSTLVDFRYRWKYQAERGGNGQGSNKHGKDGEDVIIRVPPGTFIKDEISGELLVDLTQDNAQFIAVTGGRGGRGNARFKSSTNQTPRHAEPGKPGEERHLLLELKLLADIGIIGFPNVGKSTLISRISSARPKIADYAFTTLTPNLGVVRVAEERSFVVVDIPGLIEGASLGKGLGIQFLRHIERTRYFVHMLDMSVSAMRDPLEDFRLLNLELERYNPDLRRRPQIVVANKIDVMDDPERLDTLRSFCRAQQLPCFPISAVTGAGVNEVVVYLTRLLFSPENEEASHNA